MESKSGVKLWREGPVVRMRFNRPEKKNALTTRMLSEMNRFLRLEPEDRAFVLDAEGEDFCAGADLEDLSKTDPSEEGFPDQLDTFLSRLSSLPVPTLCCVKGRVLGGAIGCLAVCDTVVCEQGAIFALPEVRLGLAPAIVAPFLREKVGPGHMRHWFLRGASFCEQDALRAGLVHVLIPKKDSSFVEVWIKDICRGAPEAQVYAKRLAMGLEPGGAAGLHQLITKREAREGFQAFFEKRHPHWGPPKKDV
jgi:methylglutaconyl-CoA hydratase